MSNSLLGRVFGGEKKRVPRFDWTWPVSVAIWQCLAVLLSLTACQSVAGLFLVNRVKRSLGLSETGSWTLPKALVYSWFLLGLVWVWWFAVYWRKTAWRRTARLFGFNFLKRIDKASVQSIPPLDLWENEDFGRM